VGANVTACNAKIPLQTITCEGASFDIVTEDMDEQVINMFAKQAPREKLRPLGLNDRSIPPTLKAVFKIKPVLFGMRHQSTMQRFFSTVCAKMVSVRYQDQHQDLQRSGNHEDWIEKLTQRYFSAPESTNSEADMNSFRNNESDYVLLSCDSDDAEAVSVSRLIYSLMSQFTTSDSARSGRSGVDSYDVADFGSERVAWKSMKFVQDVDLSAEDLKLLVEGARIPAVLVLLTSGSLNSASQLLRIGFMQKFAPPTAPFTPIPLAISDAFTFPGLKHLEDIESGKALTFGSTVDSVQSPRHSTLQAASMSLTTANISTTRIRVALSQILETRIIFVDVPKKDVPHLHKLVERVVFRLIHASSSKSSGANSAMPSLLQRKSTAELQAMQGKGLARSSTTSRPSLIPGLAPSGECSVELGDGTWSTGVENNKAEQSHMEHSADETETTI
jgi:hypothetical protein